jgi:hypothetical protein
MFSRKIITVLLFITILLLIYIIQPYFIFNKDGTYKNFGYNDKEQSLITVFVVIPIIAIISFIIVLSLELIYT